MNTKTLLIIATAIIALFIVVSTLQYTQIQKFKQMIEQQDTTIITKHDTLWKDTTITEKELVPKYIVKTKTDTVYTSNGDTLQLVTESKMYDKRLTTDKDTADIQIYTTGINTSLDSLKWRLKTHRVNTTEIVTITKFVEHKKLRITPQVGMGYGVFNKQCDMYIGLGFSYSF